MRFYLSFLAVLFWITSHPGYSQSTFTLHTGMTYSSVRPYSPGNPPAPILDFKPYYYVGIGVNNLITSSFSVNVKLQQALKGGTFQQVFSNEQSWKYSFLELSLVGEKTFFDRIGVYGGTMVGKMTQASFRNGQDDFQKTPTNEIHKRVQYSALAGVKIYVNTVAIVFDYNYYFQSLIEIPLPPPGISSIVGIYKEKLQSFNVGLELYF